MGERKTKIAIRTDGNSVLGLGHIMRCSSIAAALKRKHISCVFIAADADSAAVVLEQGFEVKQLDSNWHDLSQETEKMVNFIQAENISLLLIDSYYVSEQYLKRLRDCVVTVYLTGMNDFLYPVDILINYHIYAEHMGYQEKYTQDTKLVLGCRYAPLREEFMQTPLYEPERKAIFITTGGTDPYDVVPELLKRFLETKCSEWEYYVILGKYFKEDERERLLQIKSRFKNIHLYQNVRNMAEIMKKCSIAVSAAGSTLYELCASGIPTVTFAFADNQLRPAASFYEQGIMESAGDVRQNFVEKLEKITEKAVQYAENPDLLLKISNTMRKHIDGCGAERLAKILLDEAELCVQ